MNTMLSKALREFTTGPLNQLIVNLGGQEGDQWEEELKKFLRKEPCWSNGQVAQVTQPKTKPSILELVSTVVVSATTSKFVAKDKFVRDIGCKAKVKISYLGENFTNWFLSGDGKTEDPIGEQTLLCRKLLKCSVDDLIITELGGEEKSETTLTEMFSLLEKQNNGKVGVLLNNNYCNIFCIRDQNGVPRMVGVRWDGDGWLIDVVSVNSLGGWYGGCWVFSRNSLESSEPSALAQA